MISTFFGTDSVLMDVTGRLSVGWTLLGLAGEGIFLGGPLPKRRPCPPKGMNDVEGVGRATIPPCVGLAFFGTSVSDDPTDGDLTVIVELPLFLTIPPTNPVTVLPLIELALFDELKYPEMGLPLAGLLCFPLWPFKMFPFTGLIFLAVGCELFKGVD